MSGVPTKLTYNNSSDETVVIGRMLTGENDNITTCTIKDSADAWNQLIIEGNQVLQENLPVGESEFGTARNGEQEPEILVEVFRNGDWEVRDRFYATEGGAVDDTGFYKNNSLYGHGKYIGEQRVEITDPITGDISDGMEALLPDGYSLQAPDDIDIPSLTDYTFKGKRENGFLDLANPHNWVLVFTADLDENNDYIVRFEPKGYGDVQGTIIRGIDPFSYDYWKKKDTKTVVSEVTVLGNTAAGETVQQTVTAEDPDIKRSLTKRVGYPITEAEAEQIGDDLLQPSFVEHGALEGPLFIDNTVNFSVGILDETRNIDDVFTVVEQRDYLHQGETYFSFVFEKEANIKENFMRKGVREERDALFTSSESQTTVGPLDINDNVTDTEQVTDQYDSDTQFDHNHGNSNSTSDVGQIENNPQNLFQFSTTINDDSAVSDSTTVFYDGNILQIDFNMNVVGAGYGEEFIVEINAGSDTLFSRGVVTNNGGVIDITEVDLRNHDGESIEIIVVNKTGSSQSVELGATVLLEEPHNHFVSIADTNGDTADLIVQVNDNDSTAGDTSSLTVSGETVDDLLDLIETQLNKTDR